MLAHTGLPLDAFEITDVPITYYGENFIHTIQVGDRSKEKLVLVHGYGGSGVMFWPIIKALAEKFHLIMVDILGMGGSSRPNVKINEAESADKFLCEFLEEWRKAFGDITNFILAGHSFGGYTVGLYACKYHRHIKKLLMLSPAGVHSRPDDFNIDRELESFPAERRLPKFVYKLTPAVWWFKLSPFWFMRRSGGILAKKQLDKFV